MAGVDKTLKQRSEKKRRKNSEVRKEKSRDAARSRRGKESEHFNEINALLPYPRSITSNIDKSTSLRLFIAYLQLKQFLINMNYKGNTSTNRDAVVDKLYSETIDGFVLLITLSGDIVFLSENVKKYLGVSQMDMVGHSLYEFSHPCDHEEIKGMLSYDDYEEKPESLSRQSLLRMKCTVNKRETKVKKASYKVMRCVGKIVDEAKPSSKHSLPKEKDDVASTHLKLVSIASPIPHPANIEILLDHTTFLTRHSLDMKFTHIDPSIHTLLHYQEEEMLNKSMYMYIHAADVVHVSSSFQKLFKKGQCDTDLYRFMVKNGGFVWIVTQATLIYGNKTSSFPQCVVCVHYVNSHVIEKTQIVAEEQINENAVPVITRVDPVSNHVPLQSTDSIFSPRTQDMNTGYLSLKDVGAEFQEFKDDPNDLTHLAPNAGDACVPLDISTLSNESMADWMIMDTPIYDKTLSSLNESSVILNNASDPPLTSDPFLSYRDDSVLTANDKTTSACLECTSEDGSDSLSPSQSPQELLDGIYSVPLEDFPTLSVTDSVIWGNTDNCLLPSKVQESNEEDNSTLKFSSLARLLQSETHGNHINAQTNYSDTSRLLRGHLNQSPCGKGKTNSQIKLKTPKLPSLTPIRSDRSKNSINGAPHLFDDRSLINCDNWKMKRHFSDPEEKSKLRKRLRKDNGSHNVTNNASVLKNLLLDGHDAEYNCDINNVRKMRPKTTTRDSEIPNKLMPVTLAKLLLADNTNGCNTMDRLMYLTCEDAEVNAPTNYQDDLLTGTELLNALEEKSVPAPLTQLCAT